MQRTMKGFKVGRGDARSSAPHWQKRLEGLPEASLWRSFAVDDAMRLTRCLILNAALSNWR